jgi:hypothetical protein
MDSTDHSDLTIAEQELLLIVYKEHDTLHEVPHGVHHELLMEHYSKNYAS